MGQLNGFDADRKMAQRHAFTVTISARTFHRSKLNGARMRELIALGEESKKQEDSEKADAAGGLAAVYEQIALMLVDDSGESPEAAWLDEELDFDVATELLDALTPKGAQGNAVSEAA